MDRPDIALTITSIAAAVLQLTAPFKVPALVSAMRSPSLAKIAALRL